MTEQPEPDNFLRKLRNALKAFSPTPVCWAVLSAGKEMGEQFGHLTDWVNWLVDRYALDHRTASETDVNVARVRPGKVAADSSSMGRAAVLTSETTHCCPRTRTNCPTCGGVEVDTPQTLLGGAGELRQLPGRLAPLSVGRGT